MRYEPHLSLEEVRQLLEEIDEISDLLKFIDQLDQDDDDAPKKLILPYVSEDPLHEPAWVK